MHYKINNSNGDITTIRVFGDDYSNESTLINGKWISELKKYNLFSKDDDNEAIISIVYNAILLKNNNKKAIEGCIAKYDFGNDTEFIYKLVPQLNYFLQIHSIDLLVSFFEEAKVQDLNDFIYHPKLINFE